MIFSDFQRREFPRLVVFVVSAVFVGACSNNGGLPEAQSTVPPEPPTPEVSSTFDEGANEQEAAQLSTVRRALEQGVDPNKADDQGQTALMMAAFDGLDHVVRLLLDNDADVDLRDGMGRTALMYAASGPFAETVNLLLDAGAEVDAVDTDEHWSALMFAAGEGQAEVVEVLLERGADRSMADTDGETAEDHARIRGHQDLAALLRSWPNPPSD